MNRRADFLTKLKKNTRCRYTNTILSEINSPFQRESFPGRSLGNLSVNVSYRTPEYYASMVAKGKETVTPWQRNSRDSLRKDTDIRKYGERPGIGDW